MIKTLSFSVTGQCIEIVEPAMLVAGTVNIYTAVFSFDAEWDDYVKTAVFRCGGIEKEKSLSGNSCTVPWEVLIKDEYLRIGIYGVKSDGTRLPTIWTDRLLVHPGAGPTEEAAEPSPTLVEQLITKVGNLDSLKTEDKSSLVAAINEVWSSGGGGSGGGTTDHSKLKNRDAAGQHPMSAITGLEAALEGKQAAGNYLTDKALDATLTVEGKAADAAAVGARLSSLSEEIAAKAANVYIGPVQPTDGTLYWLDTSESGGSGGETVTYSITAALTNVTIDNTAGSANEGESFAAALTVSDGYELSSVKITMGGADITSTAYASGNIYISAVTGDVVITAVAVEVSVEVTTYTITNNLVNATSDNSAVSAEENASYTATLTATDGYTLEGATVTITMGGVDVTSDVYADGVVAIHAVTGDVVINVIGAEYIGESVSMTYNANLQKFPGYYSDDGVTPMEKPPRDRGGFFSAVFEVDTKITASFTVAQYQNVCYGYGNHIVLGDDTKYFYGGVYCASGKYEITITVPAGNRFMIVGTYETQCTDVVVHGKEV